MSLSRTFIDRPVFAAVLSIAIFVGGLIAIPLLPVSEYPDVIPPAVVVTATYPGANPKVIAETVAAPIEEQINGVENMLYMSSQATTDGMLNVTVTFKIGTDPDLAETQVQNRVQRALPRLPPSTSSLRPPSESVRAMTSASSMLSLVRVLETTLLRFASTRQLMHSTPRSKTCCRRPFRVCV